MVPITEKPKIGDRLIYQRARPRGVDGHPLGPPSAKPFTVVDPISLRGREYHEEIIGMLFDDGMTDLIRWKSGEQINPFLFKEES